MPQCYELPFSSKHLGGEFFFPIVFCLFVCLFFFFVLFCFVLSLFLFLFFFFSCYLSLFPVTKPSFFEL